MDILANAVRAVDLFADKLTFNFEDGVLTKNFAGKYGVRSFRHALGHSVQTMKNKLAVRIR